MQKCAVLTLVLLGSIGLTQTALSGPEAISSKEMKQTAVQQPECFYRDNELNISAFGAYAFSGTGYDRPDIEDVDDLNIIGTYDRFLGDDTWGGGLEVKYFFRRYFGIGIEGFGLAGNGDHAVLDHGTQARFEEAYFSEDHFIGGVVGTFTLRYPIGCSRFAPYAWAGGGGVFGGRND
jgi:hypothetical protein